jgi:hypothetical protein
MRAINNLAVVAQSSDRPTEANELFAKAIAIARARGHRARLTSFGAALAATQYENGNWDNAFAVATETLPDGIQHHGNANLLALYLAKASFERGDDDGARAWFARTPADLAQSADFQNAATGGMREALEAFLGGDLTKGVDDLTRVWDLFGEREELTRASDALELAADFAVLLGDPAGTLPLAERYATAPEPAITRTLRTQGERLRAFRAVAAGEEDVAADAFAEALGAARSLGLAVYTAHVLADYGVWLVDCGRAGDAEPLLHEAHELFERMGATRCLERIDAVRPKEPATV